MKICVLGAGVSGLTSAVLLQENGHQVSLWAKTQSPFTTSDSAGAVWYPHRAEPEPLVRQWARESFRVLKGLHFLSNSGVSFPRGERYFYRLMGDPWWRDLTPDFERLPRSSLPDRSVAGFRFSAPVIDMKTYLGHYLRSRFLSSGGIMVAREVQAMIELESRFEIVVNCTGIGARELTGDPLVTPSKSRMLHISSTGKPGFTLAPDHPEGRLYRVAHLDGARLSGPIEKNGGLEETTSAILDRYRREYPEVRDASLISVSEGVRAVRASIRVEKETTQWGQKWIHNYGHGGAGVTLSWGAALEVCRLIKD